MKINLTVESIIFVAVAILSGCFNKTKHAPEAALYDLKTSTELIHYLIKHNRLAEALEPCESVDIERLVNNFSPAMLAMEAEVFNCTLPVILCFVDKSAEHYKNLTMELERLANESETSIKWIVIDCTEFFTLAQQFEIITAPTLVLMQERNEIGYNEDITLENLAACAQELHSLII